MFDQFNRSELTMMSHRETDKYTKGFILKCMNVIIESRLGESVVRKCSPTRNDWFNIAINDNEEVTQTCLDTLDNLHWVDPKSSDEQKLSSGFTIDIRWKVACEISLKTQDGKLFSLEYWMFENNPCNSQDSTPPSASSPSNVSPSSPSGSPIMNSRNPNSFACVHQKMSLMLKSLMSLTRGSPSFKLSCVGPADDSHVIFYRICQCDVDFSSFLQSINPDTPDVHSLFSPEVRLGSIFTNHNSIGISFCQRLKLDNCRLFQPTMTKEDDDTALFKEDHFGGARKQESSDDRNSPCFVSKAREPRLAFGSISPVVLPFPLLPPLPKGFPGISDDEDDDINAPIDGTISSPRIFKRKLKKKEAPTKNQSSDDSYPQSTSSEEKDRCESPEDEIKPPNVSQPIVIPSDRRNPNYHEPRHVDNSPLGSAESYVFIENRPPFAPEHDDIQILFNGPKPSFVTNPSGSGELLNIQETLAALETESENIDAFLEALNVKSGEDDEEDLLKSSSSNLPLF